MATKRLPVSGQDAGDWGQLLNAWLGQLGPEQKGGLNTWDETTKPANLTAEDEGKTGINASTGQLERWNGTAWQSLVLPGIISVGGNIGIGELTPEEKLTVNGKIKAKEVIVTQENWADFVFEENYPLLSLQDLQRFISSKKHLPGIPSSQEIIGQNVSLNQMNVLLLQKIEELTLYVLQLEKRLKKVEKKD